MPGLEDRVSMLEQQLREARADLARLQALVSALECQRALAALSTVLEA